MEQWHQGRWELAAAVRARRAELGLNRTQFIAKAGVTYRISERLEAPNESPDAFLPPEVCLAADRALDWPEGTTEQLQANQTTSLAVTGVPAQYDGPPGHTPLMELGMAVKVRRAVLNLSTRAVRSAGGPTLRTQNLIEKAERNPHYRIGPTVAGQLDKALQWPVGTTQNILAGVQTAHEAANLPALARRDVNNVDQALVDNLSVRKWAAGHAEQFVEFCRAVENLPDVDTKLSGKAKRLANDVARWQAMLQLEDAKLVDGTVGEELVDRFAEVLDATPPRPNTAERDRFDYRRWLADLPVSPTTRARCEALWQLRSTQR